MFRTTSTRGKTYEYDYSRPTLDGKVWAGLLAVCKESGQKPRAALEEAIRQWLERKPR